MAARYTRRHCTTCKRKTRHSYEAADPVIMDLILLALTLGLWSIIMVLRSAASVFAEGPAWACRKCGTANALPALGTWGGPKPRWRLIGQIVSITVVGVCVALILFL